MANLPRTLGRYGYEVVAALGHGGMGTVYRARDPRLGRELAIKLLREGYDSTDSRDRFTREARSAGSLSHPNIVTIYDIGEHEGRPFIAMEYVPGENFAELIRSKTPLPLARKIQMIEEVCGGLSHAHEAGVVHRDIKPANLMVGPGGTVKILDFGLARLLQASGMTKPGDILGTLNYMSPEQIRGGVVDRRADIFGVGAVLYELLSGHQAFPGKAPGVVFQQILNGVPVPLAVHCPDIEPRLAEIVDQALEKDPARRFQTVEELQEELENVRWSLPEEPEPIAEVASDDDQTVMTEREEEITGELLRPPQAGGALATQRAQQIESHLAAAARAYEAGDYDSAIESCKQVLLLDPSETRAAAQRDRAHAAIDEKQVQTWLAEARRHLSQGAIAAASTLVESAIERSPHHPDLASIRTEIDNEKSRVRSEAVRAAIGHARSSFGAGDLATALTRANEALEIDPASEAARNLKAEIENAVTARKEESRIRGTVEEARRRFMNGEHDAALRLLNTAPAAHPLVATTLDELRNAQRAIAQQQREAQEHKERQQRVAALIADARAALQREQFEAALKALDRAHQIDPAVPEVAELTRRVREEQAAAQLEADLARALGDIDERLSGDDLAGAEASLRAATALGANDARVRAAHRRLDQATTARAAREAAAARERESEHKTTEAADLVQRGDFAGAGRLLSSAAELNPANPRVALVAAQLHHAIEKREAAERLRQQVEELVRLAAEPLQAATAQPADLMQALSRVDEALALDPTHAEALALRPPLEAALEASREQARLLAAISNARRRFASGKHLAALQLLEGLEPSSHPLVVEALSELRAAQQEIERQRQTEQLLAEARTALQAQQFTQALDALARARAIDATAADLAGLTEQAEAGQAAAAARARESEQLTAEAAQLFATGDLTRATPVVNRAIELDPQNASARALAAQLREAAAQRAAAEAAERRRRQEEIERILATASQRLQSSDFPGAGELLESILQQDPTHAGAQQLKGTLEKAIRTAQKEAARKQQRIDEGLAAAAKHAQRLRFPQAIQALEEVLSLEPHHERATQLLAEVREAEQRHRIAQEVEALLKQAAAADSHERALALVQQALVLDPTSEAARTRQAEIESAVAARNEALRVRAVVEEARQRFMSGEHDAALALLEAESTSSPLVATTLDELRSAQRAIAQRQQEAQERQERQQRVATLVAEARVALQGQQFTAALETLERAHQIDPTVPEVAELTRRVRQEQAAAQLELDLARTLADIDERLSADDLAGAEAGLRAATALAATDPRVRAARGRLDQATAARAAREAAAARERDSERKTTEAADLVQRGDLAGAERLLASAAELNPENSRVALVATQLQEAIELRAEAERVRQRAADLVRAAAQPLQSPNAQTPDLVEALSRLDEALVLDPDNAEAPALRPALESALEASREQVRLLAAIGNARRRFANGKHQAALQLLESLQPESHPLVVKALSELRAAQHRIEQQRQRIDAGLAAAAKHAQRLKFPQAIHDLEEVLRLEPDHERATQLLAEVREAQQRHRVAQEVESLLKQAAATDSHERALALLRQALKIAPDDRRVIDMMLERTTALSPEIGELTIDMSTRRPGAVPAPYRQLKEPTPPALPKPAALGILANRQSILIVGSAVVVALAILAFQFWPSRQATDAGKTGAVSAGPVSAAIPVSTFSLVISGDYPFEVEIQGATRPASATHAINLPAGVASQIRLKRPEVFLDVSVTVRGEAGELKMLRAPALSSVTVYNSFNSSCEILIDGRLVGRDPVTQALIAGGHDVSLKCAEGRTPMPKHVDVVATRANQVTFTKQD